VLSQADGPLLLLPKVRRAGGPRRWRALPL